MDARDSLTFFAHGDDVRNSLSLFDARIGPPLTIVMNNPEVPKIHGALKFTNFFISTYSCGQGQGSDVT